MARQVPLTKSTALALLRLGSWKLTLYFPPSQSFVLTGAPHTTNWDFYYFLLVKFATGLEIKWIGKDSLFRGPMGWVMRGLGGIPVDRKSSHNYVAQIAETLKRDEPQILLIAPEGTRKKAGYWKTGFYYIALEAGLPIALGFLNYKTRELGIGPYFYPTGDIQADFPLIQKFYEDKIGRHPERQGNVQLRPEPIEDGPDGY